MFVSDSLDLYIFPTGRRAFAQRQVAERARQFALTDLAAHADAAVAHEAATLQLELKRQSAGASGGRFSPETVALDGKLDRAVTGLDSALDVQIRMYDEDSPQAQAATTIRRAIFPDGPGAITQLPFEEESEATGALLKRLEQPDLAPAITAIPGLADHIAQVRARLDAYRLALAKDIEKKPSTASIHDMRTQGQELLAQTVVLILAHYVANKNIDITRALKAPIDRQTEALRDAYRRRRPPVDVDPTTGEEIVVPEPVDGDPPPAS